MWNEFTATEATILNLEPGTVIGEKFEVLEKIGSGGMGTVYKACHLSLSKTIVLKFLDRSTHNADKAIVRFQNEAKILSRLKHPGIAEVYDVGTTESGQPFIALEFIDGISLEQFIESAIDIPLSQLLQIFIETSDALLHAHEAGVIHRDIKPGNIMLVKNSDDRYAPVLLDFGIARLDSDTTNGDSQNLTAHGALLGSPLYVSPEQATAGSVTERSDQYSLGCVFYECLSGQPPFFSDTVVETIRMHREDQPASLVDSELFNISPELDQLIGKMLAKHPESRFSKISDLVVALTELAEKAAEEEDVAARGSEKAAEHLPHYEMRKFLSPPVLITSVLVSVLACLFAAMAVTGLKIPAQNDVVVQKDAVEEQLRAELNAYMKKLRRSRAPFIDMSPTRRLFPVRANDDDMKIFDGITYASSADLSKMLITDRSLWYLRKSNLIVLHISLTFVKTLEFVPEFKNLEELDMNACIITDAALDNLVEMKKLRRIVLKNCDSLTDVGFRKLLKIKSLQWVEIKGTSISDKLAKELQQKMPATFFKGYQDCSLVQPLWQEAMKLESNQEYEKARLMYKKACDQITEAQGEDAPLAVPYLIQQSVCLQYLNQDLPEAESLLERAIAISRARDDKKELARTLGKISHFCFVMQHNVPKALELRTEQLKMLEQSGGLQVQFRDCLYAMAHMQRELKNYQASKQLAEKCLEMDLDPQDKKRDPSDYTYDCILLATNHANLNQLVKADEYLLRAVNCTHDPHNLKDAMTFIDLFGNLAMVRERQGKVDDALACAQRSYKVSHAFKIRGREDADRDYVIRLLRALGRNTEADKFEKQTKALR